MWGHDYHFHIRISCSAGSPDCRHQDPVPPGDGCGKALDWWFHHRQTLGLRLLEFFARCRVSDDQRTITFIHR